ncbi:MAG: type I methionyl aminopeptidase [Candidatus Magasanikbacteria bacterium]|jgi:methionyl aminopeptidase
MALIKTQHEIEKIIIGCKLTGEILEKLYKMVKPGMSTWEVDQMAERLIEEAGGRPAFKGFKGHKDDIPFPSTICACVNEELVHGIAKKNCILKDGDIFTIDIGMEWPFKKGERGYFTDTAYTVAVGKISKETEKLLRVTQESLEAGIKAAIPGNSVADIGRAVENYVKSQGKYGIIRDLVGHGVGHAVHEDPRIPNYYDPKLEKIKIKPGMVLAIEPMVSMGDWRVDNSPDNWTIIMADSSMCAHFEHTVVITKTGNIVATRRPGEID